MGRGFLIGPDAVKPGIEGVWTRWNPGFMASRHRTLPASCPHPARTRTRARTRARTRPARLRTRCTRCARW